MSIWKNKNLLRIIWRFQKFFPTIFVWHYIIGTWSDFKNPTYSFWIFFCVHYIAFFSHINVWRGLRVHIWFNTLSLKKKDNINYIKPKMISQSKNQTNEQTDSPAWNFYTSRFYQWNHNSFKDYEFLHAHHSSQLHHHLLLSRSYLFVL